MGWKKSKKPTFSVRTKKDAEQYIEVALEIGFTRKEALQQLHANGIYISKLKDK